MDNELLGPSIELVASTRNARDVLRSAAFILNKAQLCAIATSHPDSGEPHINNAFFAADAAWSLIFMSPSGTVHGTYVRHRPQVAAAIALEPRAYGEGLRGLQLVGSCAEVQGPELDSAVTCYAGRFERFLPTPLNVLLADSTRGGPRLFKISVSRFKLLDELRFSRREYIEGVLR